MNYEYIYNGLIERQRQIEEAEALGLRMLHDNFDNDWKKGDEPHGIMVFTDELSLEPIPARDLAHEIDILKEKIILLERR